MAKRTTATHATTDGHTAQDVRAPVDERERKQRVLTKGRASITRSIADALVIKDGDVFFLCERDGNVAFGGARGFASTTTIAAISTATPCGWKTATSTFSRRARSTVLRP